jgi:hypothetical protein
MYTNVPPRSDAELRLNSPGYAAAKWTLHINISVGVYASLVNEAWLNLINAGSIGGRIVPLFRQSSSETICLLRKPHGCARMLAATCVRED